MLIRSQLSREQRVADVVGGLEVAVHRLAAPCARAASASRRSAARPHAPPMPPICSSTALTSGALASSAMLLEQRVVRDRAAVEHARAAATPAAARSMRSVRSSLRLAGPSPRRRRMRSADTATSAHARARTCPHARSRSRRRLHARTAFVPEAPSRNPLGRARPGSLAARALAISSLQLFAEQLDLALRNRASLAARVLLQVLAVGGERIARAAEAAVRVAQADQRFRVAARAPRAGSGCTACRGWPRSSAT